MRDYGTQEVIENLLPGEKPQHRDDSAHEGRPAVPYGDNPYFPANQDASAGAEDDQAGDTELVGTSETIADQGQGEPDPTFDVEQDRAAGIDVDSPVYRKAYELIAKAQTAVTDPEVEAKALEARKRLAEEQQAANADDFPDLEVGWEGFQINRLSQDDPLSGHEDTIARIVREHVEYAVASVNRQNRQFVEQQRATQTRDYIVKVIDEIGAVGGPQAKSKALDLLQEYAPFAKTAPQKWARFVVSELGISVDGQSPQAPATPAAAAPAQATPTNNKLPQQVKGRSVPPSAPKAGAAASKTPKFSGKQATADAVAWAFDQAIAGKL